MILMFTVELTKKPMTKKRNCFSSSSNHRSHVDPDWHDGVGVSLDVNGQRELDGRLAVEVDPGRGHGIHDRLDVREGRVKREPANLKFFHLINVSNRFDLKRCLDYCLKLIR